MKSVLKSRLTTVFVRQGHYALAPEATTVAPAPDMTIGEYRRPHPSQFVRLPGTAMTITKRLHDLGQSLWLDNITREILDNALCAATSMSCRSPA